jgi:cell division transport system permease protein
MSRVRPFYFLRRAWSNLRGAPLPAAVTAATIAIVIFLFGAFLLTGQNVYRALVGWAGEGDPIVVYVRRGLPAAASQTLARHIQALPEVARVDVTSPEEGMKDLRRALGEDADVLEGIEAGDVLPAAISVGLRGSSLDRETIGLLAARLRHLEGVESVDSETAWLERFARLARLLLWVGLVWGAILGFGALLVIGNSTRLAALTRKEEIEVLRLVGASEAFIVVPFFLEGAIQGLAGSLLGLGALATAFFGVQGSLAGDPFLTPFLGGLRFLAPPGIAGLVVAGPLLGAIGSVGSARRFLRGIEL